jgi:hypothetical protein
VVHVSGRDIVVFHFFIFLFFGIGKLEAGSFCSQICKNESGVTIDERLPGEAAFVIGAIPADYYYFSHVCIYLDPFLSI